MRFRRRQGLRLEGLIEAGLALAAFLAVAVTLGIAGTLLWEALPFFREIGVAPLFGTEWAPLFAAPRYGLLPLLSGTLVITAIALLVSVPVGTILAIYLSEYAPSRAREILKPALELLSAVPTVVYGYFALLFVTPLLRRFLPDLGAFNMLSAGLVMGLMIVPYVSSLAEDAMRSVPMALREASYAMGATRLETSVRVVVPAAFSGLVSAYVLAVSRAVGETMVVAIAAGMQPNLSLDPRDPAQTVTSYIVQVTLGDLPHGSIGYQTIFVAGLSLFFVTLAFNIGGHFLRRRYREAY